MHLKHARFFTLLAIFLFNYHNSLSQTEIGPIEHGYTVNYYHLNVVPSVTDKAIRGNVLIVGKIYLDNFIIVDLVPELSVDSVFIGQDAVKNYSLDKGHIRIELPANRKHEIADTVIVYYSGAPRKAKRPPWDGGFIWTADPTGSPWVGVACQGIGASTWWPLKDDLADEPDSMRISIQAPAGLMAVSNGQLERVDHHPDSSATWHWFVSYPINPYNVTLNIAAYSHLQDQYKGKDGLLPLNYYVLKHNEGKAREHFKQVHSLLNCFESEFGPYPFYRDGYALVETPYWGMEHQSAIAYGNNYINNRWGFDFIIVHESGHEWFGNNLSIGDDGELWIHESLTTYAEAVYVECTQGYDAALSYMVEHRRKIANTEPMLGPLGVKFNDRKTSDIYYKGAWMWLTLRTALGDEELWKRMIRDMRDTFRLKIVDTKSIIQYVNNSSGQDWTGFFNQYLTTTALPILEYRWVQTAPDTYQLEHRWALEKPDTAFRLPVLLLDETNTRKTITPGLEWTREPWSAKAPHTWKPAERMMLIQLREI